MLPSRRSAAKASSISRRIVCRVASSGLFSSISRPEGPYDASMLGLLLRDRGEDIRRLAVQLPRTPRRRGTSARSPGRRMASDREPGAVRRGRTEMAQRHLVGVETDAGWQVAIFSLGSVSN